MLFVGLNRIVTIACWDLRPDLVESWPKAARVIPGPTLEPVGFFLCLLPGSARNGGIASLGLRGRSLWAALALSSWGWQVHTSR